MDNLAMAATGGIGFITRNMLNPVSGIRDQELPAAALAPTEEMLARGETSGGVFRSVNEALGQGIGALGNAGQGLMNAGTNISEAFTNAVQNTAEGLVNAGVNTAEAMDAAIRNTTEEFTNAGVNVMDLFRTEPEPQVQRQLDDAPLDENMYGRGMFDLAAPLPQGATVPRASITKDLDKAAYFDDFRNRFEQSIDQNRPLEEVDQNTARMLQEIGDMQQRRQEDERRMDSGTTFEQLKNDPLFLDSSVRSNFPDTIQIADARTYQPKYQGQSGIFRAGKGKGQTYYGGQKEGSFLDQDYMEQLRQLREKAGNVFNYFTT